MRTALTRAPSRRQVLNGESRLRAGEDEDQFEQFMLPLTAAFEAVAQMLSTNTFNEQEAKVTASHPFSPLFSFSLRRFGFDRSACLVLAENFGGPGQGPARHRLCLQRQDQLHDAV